MVEIYSEGESMPEVSQSEFEGKFYSEIVSRTDDVTEFDPNKMEVGKFYPVGLKIDDQVEMLLMVKNESGQVDFYRINEETI